MHEYLEIALYGYLALTFIGVPGLMVLSKGGIDKIDNGINEFDAETVFSIIGVFWLVVTVIIIAFFLIGVLRWIINAFSSDAHLLDILNSQTDFIVSLPDSIAEFLKRFKL